MDDWTGFEKIVTLAPAFDERHSDPSKNCGIHGVELRMVLKGPIGATQFVVYTNWQLPHVQAELDAKPLGQFRYILHKPLAADIGYHSPHPQYEDQTAMPCDVLGGLCYYDGSSLQAEEIFEVLLREGSYGVWRELWKRWFDLFGGMAEAQGLATTPVGREPASMDG